MSARILPSAPNFDLRSLIAPAVAAGLIALVFLLPAETQSFPESWNLGLRAPIDAWQSDLIARRETMPVFEWFFDPVSALIDTGLRWAENLLLAVPWPAAIAASILAGYLLGGPRLAVLGGAGPLVMGLFGLWAPSLQTLALMAVAVALSVLIGLPIGILAALNDRFDRVLRPVLDAMQTMPTFVYLIPVVLFFGIARVPSVVATLVYAVPPMIRLTNLGLRQVNPASIEAARAFGSTRLQLLVKVQLPLALPAVMTGVNQTIMMALSMVVIAALIGAGGLGREVLLALQRLQVGRALEAGLSIVLLAIVLDRLSEGLSQLDFSGSRPRDPEPGAPRWLPDDWARLWMRGRAAARDTLSAPARTLASLIRLPGLADQAGLVNSLLIVAVLLLAGRWLQIEQFPAGWRWDLHTPTDQAVRWMRDNLFEIQLGGLTAGTGPLSDAITLYMLNPMRVLFTGTLPWLVIVLASTALAFWARSGPISQRLTLALFAGGSMFALGLLGLWDHSMDTLSQILVTMLFTILAAVPLGIWSSQSDAVRDFLRPVLDFLQTIPSFVFLVPVIMLFNIGRVPGILAAVLYAIAPGIKLTDLGIRQVSGEAVEAARAFGSTQAQTLAKVQVPMALPSILVGVNQMIMMVLAMVVISGMVGGAGLGLEAVNGLARSETGRGFEAGLAIVLMAMVMDRITQAWADRP